MTEKLPSEILKQLNATDHKLLDVIGDMLERSGKKNPSKKEYVCPGEKWLAWRIGRCRQTVSESIQKLTLLGFIRTMQRRQIRQRWQTNLYRFGYWALRVLGRLKEAVFCVSSPCRLFTTHSKKTLLISKATTALRKHSYKLKGPPDENLPWVTFFNRRTEEELSRDG